MKKLLTILGSVALIASTSSLVVACKPKVATNDETGSNLVNTIAGPDGRIEINAVGLLRWYQKNIGFNGVKQVKEFNQLFAVGLMVEASKPESTIFYGDNALWKEPNLSKNKNLYGLEEFPKKLKELWGTENDKGTTTVQGAARDAFDKFEKGYEGKNSRASVVNELKKQFPYVEPQYESLKRAWINNYLLTDANNSGLARLTKLLWTQSSPTIKNDVPDRSLLLRDFYANWKDSTVATIENDINTALNEKVDAYKSGEWKTNLLNLINATGGTNPNIASSSPIKPWRLADIKWADNNTTIGPDLVKDLLARLYSPTQDPNAKIEKQFEGSRTVAQHWSYVNKKGDPLTENDTYFALVDTYPNTEFTSEKYSLSSDTIFGFLTNSQRFGIDQFLINQKPISLSEIVFKKSESGDLTKNINGEAFLSPKTADEASWTQFYGLYNFLQNYVSGDTPGINEPIPGISQYNFDTIFGNLRADNTNVIRLNWPQTSSGREDKWSTNFYEVKNNEKFLTLSDTNYSKTLKYSVYDFIQANQSKSLATYKLNPNPNSAGTIRDILLTKYGFVSQNTADYIANSIAKITESDLQTQATDGLYATLNLIEQLNRKTTEENDKSSSEDQANNKIYQVLNSQQGIIAFVDTDGLHITKINGYDILNNNKGDHEIKPQSSNIFGKSIGDRTNYINQLATFKRLKDYETSDTNVGSYRYVYQDYNNQIFDPNRKPIDDPFIKKIIGNPYTIENLPSLGVSYEQLNPAITNDYERFLVNNSILSSQNPKLAPFYKFNIFNEVKDYLTSNDAKANLLSPNNSWITDYVGTVLGFNPQDKTQFITNLLDNFMKFDATIDSQEFKKWLIEVLETNIDHTRNLPQLNFRTNWSTWNQEISNSRVDEPDKNANLPLMILDWGDNQSHINNLVSSTLFQPFVNPKAVFYEYQLTSDWYRQVNSWQLNFISDRRRGQK